MRMLFILFLVTSTFSADLDTLLEKSSEGRSRARGLHGFVVRHVDNKAIAKNMQVPQDTSTFVGPVRRMQSRPIYSFNNDARINELEVSVAKMSVILENMQKQSDSHTANFDLLVKIFEILMGSLTTIAVSVVGVWKLRKPKADPK